MLLSVIAAPFLCENKWAPCSITLQVMFSAPAKQIHPYRRCQGRGEGVEGRKEEKVCTLALGLFSLHAGAGMRAMLTLLMDGRGCDGLTYLSDLFRWQQNHSGGYALEESETDDRSHPWALLGDIFLLGYGVYGSCS